ncbi:MAG: hypothetical protein FIA95_12520 [Gemmatimonadetes bacterium]|nr:hypothetical protein [Gemmatimonadota bacterium]
MTTCSELRELLLEAEPGELRGEGEGPLASHLRSCDACRRHAELLLRADEAVDEALGSEGTLDVEAVLRQACEAPAELTWKSRAVSAARRAAAARRAWIPVAAAAALTALLLVARGPTPVPVPAIVRAEAAPLVAATSAGGVAILETDSPNITVLWFFEQGT